MKNKTILIIGLFLFIILLWVLSSFYIDYLFPSETTDYLANRGTFGDKFGFINSLFSGLALTGVIISIFIQQKELSLQREELLLTRQEFKDQNFQTTFFNLLKTQRQIAEEIECEVWNMEKSQKTKKSIKGRLFFNISKSEISKIIWALKPSKFIDFNAYTENYNQPRNEVEEAEDYHKLSISFPCYIYNITKEEFLSVDKDNEIELAKLATTHFLDRYNFATAHYFSHLYHILKFLESYEKNINEQNEDSDIYIKGFVNFIRAQMSTPEMFLLYYQCYSFPKLKRLVIKYNILENFHEEDLISKEHKIEGIVLKSRE